MRFFPHLTYMVWGIIFITDGVEEANDETSRMKTPAAATYEKQRRDNSCIVRSGRGEGTGPVCLALTGMWRKNPFCYFCVIARHWIDAAKESILVQLEPRGALQTKLAGHIGLGKVPFLSATVYGIRLWENWSPKKRLAFSHVEIQYSHLFVSFPLASFLPFQIWKRHSLHGQIVLATRRKLSSWSNGVFARPAIAPFPN